ncbi:uncharacterized protein [Diadema antillarum]|uniref:uncharacterized protein n=1 Tax=Diadema antillarum TaxID=105358 RepID=UPI003A84769B
MGDKKLLWKHVTCNVFLLNASGFLVAQNIGKALTPSAHVEFGDVEPFSEYIVKAQCEVGNNGMSINHTIYRTRTPERVPSSGPKILEIVSKGLGCENPNERNVTVTIQPPELENRNGILKSYDIRYRLRPEDMGNRKWNSLVQSVPSPARYSIEVVLPGLSRWDPYEIFIYANNSKGGTGSNVRTVDPLRPKRSESRLVNLTKTQIESNVWLIKWLPPWPSGIGGCVKHYAVKINDKQVASVNDSSYTLNMETLGDVKLKIAAVIYNGIESSFEGISSEEMIFDSGKKSALSIAWISLGVVLPVVVTMAVACLVLIVRFGPRAKDSFFNLSENRILNSRKTMGLQRPKPPPEQEVYNEMPDSPSSPVSGSTEGRVTPLLIQTNITSSSSTGATFHPQNSTSSSSILQSVTNSSTSSPQNRVSIETNNGDTPSSSKQCALHLALSSLETQEDPGMSFSEDSLTSSPHPSSNSSGYVSYPPPGQKRETTANPRKPAVSPAGDGYYIFNALTNKLQAVTVSTVDSDCDVKDAVDKRKESEVTLESGTFDNELSPSKLSRPPRSVHPLEASSFYPQPDVELCSGVDTYTKLSTPLSPRKRSQTDQSGELGADQEMVHGMQQALD